MHIIDCSYDVERRLKEEASWGLWDYYTDEWSAEIEIQRKLEEESAARWEYRLVLRRYVWSEDKRTFISTLITMVSQEGR